MAAVSSLLIFYIATFLVTVNLAFPTKICRYKNLANSYLGHNYNNRLYGRHEKIVIDPEDEISEVDNQQLLHIDDDANDLSVEEKEQILSLLEREGPSDLEKRLRMMGFTPFTYAGFALAAVLISLNTILGTGWLGDIFGMNEDTTVINYKSPTKEQAEFKIIEDQNMQFDYDKLREFRAEQSKH